MLAHITATNKRKSRVQTLKLCFANKQSKGMAAVCEQRKKKHINVEERRKVKTKTKEKEVADATLRFEEKTKKKSETS